MKVLKRYCIICGALLFFGCLFFSAVPCLAGQADAVDRSTTTEFTARIMQIDLANNSMIVAEKKIHLLTSTEAGKKKWKTVFMDDSGRKISVKFFKQRDRVLVRGVRSGSEVVDAHEIILLPAQQKQKVQPVPPRRSSPVHVKEGVWTNY